MNIPERELYKTKWFPYRVSSPRDCDIIFLRDWGRCLNGFNDFYKLDLIPEGNGFSVPHLSWPSLQAIIDSPEMLHARRQRVFCDERCMPYSQYWIHAFKVFIDQNTLNTTLIQAAVSIGMLGNIVDLYNDHAAHTLILSDYPGLQSKNYSKKPYQIEYFNHVRQQVKKIWPSVWKSQLYDLAESGQYVIGFDHPND